LWCRDQSPRASIKQHRHIQVDLNSSFPFRKSFRKSSNARGNKPEAQCDKIETWKTSWKRLQGCVNGFTSAQPVTNQATSPKGRNQIVSTVIDSSYVRPVTVNDVEDEHLHPIYLRRRPDYFCRRNLRRISGQNSLKKLLRAAPSSCDAQFTAVLCKLRSWGG
jgi:hypothetical protein